MGKETLKELFERFLNDEELGVFAARSRQAMEAVFLRRIGSWDACSITDEDINQQMDCCGQPADVKAKAFSCLRHLQTWAGLNEKTTDRKAAPRQVMRNANHVGTIYHDHSSKGYSISGKRQFKDCWRAEIVVNGQRYRHRSKDREDCEQWLKAVKRGDIRPTDNHADWWRMEQQKDEQVRIDEIIVSTAEEAVLMYDYHQTGDIGPINEYMKKCLLPHMAWYCAHTLHFGRERTLTASRQAAALLLTRIVGGKPVQNFTSTCKRMLRIHKQRGNFFYYEKAPEEVRLMVNGLNLDGLAEVWKVTTDRRL